MEIRETAGRVFIDNKRSSHQEIPPTTKDLELGGGDILDQDVIHYDTWLRKHSQYAFTRLSARGLKYSALEN